jgi:hypothetical protein
MYQLSKPPRSYLQSIKVLLVCFGGPTAIVQSSIMTTRREVAITDDVIVCMGCMVGGHGQGRRALVCWGVRVGGVPGLLKTGVMG